MAELEARPLLRTFLDLTFIVELSCGAAANLLILQVFYRKPGLLTVANRFVVNLTIINILTCFFLLPLSIVDNAVTSSSPSLPLLCSVSEFASHFSSSIIPLSVLLIAVDQYFAVVNPLHYHSVINSVRSIWMIAAAWAVPVVLSTLGLVQSQLGNRSHSLFRVCFLAELERNSTTTADSSLAEPWIPFTFGLSFASVSFALPFALICFIYSRICAAASDNTKRTQPDLGGRGPIKGSSLSCTDSSKVTEREDMDWDDEDHGLQMSAKPALVLTRPSPPRAEIETSPCRTSKSASDLREELAVVPENSVPSVKNNTSLPNLRTGKEDTALLKPFLPRHTSFCIPAAPAPPQRRHSNVPIPRVDSYLLSKQGSLSKQSSFASSSGCSTTRIPVSRASSIRSTSSFLVSNLRHRLSNAGLFRYRERARAARVSALVIVMALICWLPFFTLYVLHAGGDAFQLPVPVIHPLFNSAVISLLLISTIASPGLFAFRNRKIRKEIKRIFKFPVNEFKYCPRGFSRQSFLQRVKEQVTELVTSFKPASSQKNVNSVVPAKSSS